MRRKINLLALGAAARAALALLALLTLLAAASSSLALLALLTLLAAARHSALLGCDVCHFILSTNILFDQ